MLPILTVRVHDPIRARHEEAQQPSTARVVPRRLAVGPSALAHLSGISVGGGRVSF